MITQIEMDYYRSQIKASAALSEIKEALKKGKEEVDWEQRRYEIAKEMLPVLFSEHMKILRSGQNTENPYDLLVKGAVGWADELIEELKKE